MSQRNPMNERYTTDKKRSGSTRKSAASAKPKSAAASTVTTGVKKKGKSNPKASKREQKRKERDKAYAAERKYGDPPTKRFKRIRKIWIGFLVGAIVCVGISFASSKINFMPEGSAMVFLIAAYACIIITLYLDFGKIRKMRREYAQRMEASQSKESRAQEKKRKAAARAAKKEEEARRVQEEQEKAKMKEAPIKDKIKYFFSTRKK